MILVCPGCGTTASAVVWQRDVFARQTQPLLLKVPCALQPYILEYLTLFRKDGNPLQWRRAMKLLTVFLDLVGSGRVSWEHSEQRPAPPELWAQAVDAVLDRSPRGLTNHNYLRHTAFDMAAGLAGRAERAAEAARVYRASSDEQAGISRQDAAPTMGEEPVSEEERAAVTQALRDFTRKFGS
jgi:hypothetical protein